MHFMLPSLVSDFRYSLGHADSLFPCIRPQDKTASGCGTNLLQAGTNGYRLWNKTGANCESKLLQTARQNDCRLWNKICYRLWDKTAADCETKQRQTETKLLQAVGQNCNRLRENGYRLWDKIAADWGTKLLQSETKHLQAVGQNCYRLWTKHLQATVGQNCFRLRGGGTKLL